MRFIQISNTEYINAASKYDGNVGRNTTEKLAEKNIALITKTNISLH